MLGVQHRLWRGPRVSASFPLPCHSERNEVESRNPLRPSLPTRGGLCARSRGHPCGRRGGSRHLPARACALRGTRRREGAPRGISAYTRGANEYDRGVRRTPLRSMCTAVEPLRTAYGKASRAYPVIPRPYPMPSGPYGRCHGGALRFHVRTDEFVNVRYAPRPVRHDASGESACSRRSYPVEKRSGPPPCRAAPGYRSHRTGRSGAHWKLVVHSNAGMPVAGDPSTPLRSAQGDRLKACVTLGSCHLSRTSQLARRRTAAPGREVWAGAVWPFINYALSLRRRAFTHSHLLSKIIRSICCASIHMRREEAT